MLPTTTTTTEGETLLKTASPCAPLVSTGSRYLASAFACEPYARKSLFISEASENGSGPPAGPAPVVKVSFSSSLIEGSCESGLDAAIKPTKQHTAQHRTQMRLDIVVCLQSKDRPLAQFPASLILERICTITCRLFSENTRLRSTNGKRAGSKTCPHCVTPTSSASASQCIGWGTCRPFRTFVAYDSETRIVLARLGTVTLESRGQIPSR